MSKTGGFGESKQKYFVKIMPQQIEKTNNRKVKLPSTTCCRTMRSWLLEETLTAGLFSAAANSMKLLSS